MAKVVWGQMSSRRYEEGVDHGVLYPKVGSGVPWNGLISIDETEDGHEVDSLYHDGLKYLDITVHGDFKAKLTAFSAPLEFAKCEGFVQLAPGLFVGQQPRETFGLSYRTRIGRANNPRYGYKLHIVWNCTASAPTKQRRTLGQSPEPQTYDWDISTVPPPATTYRPTAHFEIDSTLTNPAKLANLENLLYGTTATNPALPTPQAVIQALT